MRLVDREGANSVEIKFIDYLDSKGEVINIVPLIVVKPIEPEDPILMKVQGAQCLYLPRKISSSVCVPYKIDSEK